MIPFNTPSDYSVTLTNPELIRVVDHILSAWGQQTTISGSAYGPAELVAEDGFITHIVDGLYAELARKTRGRMVIETKVKWFYSDSQRVIRPVNAEVDLSGFREISEEADIREAARAVHPWSMFAARIQATTLPPIRERRLYDAQSALFNRMMQMAAQQAMRQDRMSRRIQSAYSDLRSEQISTYESEGGNSVTPDQIRAALESVDRQEPPPIPDEPYVGEHGAMRIDREAGPYPLDFDALVSQIDELTENDES
jgi:hypothetical protein